MPLVLLRAWQYDPYITVFRILNFARKHKYPLQRSVHAFTYSDDYIPTSLKIDRFAKERHGGPFTTEDVDNEKTLFRMLLLLFSLGILQVQVTLYFLPGAIVWPSHWTHL